MVRYRKYIVFFVVFAVSVAIDQGTKWWIVAHVEFAKGEIEVIPGFLSIVHAQNPGAAMGLLRNYEHRHYLFLVFTLIALAVIVDLFRRLPRTDIFMSLVLGLILSGAVGNGIDRLHKRTVTDFIRVYTDLPSLKAWLINNFGTYEWPSFNVADSALVVGVGLFLIHYMFLEEKETDEGVDLPPDDEPKDLPVDDSVAS